MLKPVVKFLYLLILVNFHKHFTKHIWNSSEQNELWWNGTPLPQVSSNIVPRLFINQGHNNTKSIYSVFYKHKLRNITLCYFWIFSFIIARLVKKRYFDAMYLLLQPLNTIKSSTYYILLQLPSSTTHLLMILIFYISGLYLVAKNKWKGHYVIYRENYGQFNYWWVCKWEDLVGW